MTPSGRKLILSPESSDGFASVGTILPSEKAAPLPGGLLISSVLLSASFETAFARPRRSRYNEPAAIADVAQLVEQLIRNQQVNGSSPFVGSI